MKLPREAFSHAEACYPQESGGFLIEVPDGQVIYFPLTNVAGRPRINFRIHPPERLAAEASGRIVGFVHSHPDDCAAPSPADLMAHAESGWWDFIISVRGGRAVDVCSLPPEGESRRALLGRKFDHGVDDCLTLVRDYYEHYEGIKLPDYVREDLWWEKGQDLYREHLPQAGFYEISRDMLQPGDLILMKILSRVENHGAIWLGDGVIIHHLYGGISSTDEYRDSFIRRTASFWRHSQKGTPRWTAWQQVW